MLSYISCTILILILLSLIPAILYWSGMYIYQTVTKNKIKAFDNEDDIDDMLIMTLIPIINIFAIILLALANLIKRFSQTLYNIFLYKKGDD